MSFKSVNTVNELGAKTEVQIPRRSDRISVPTEKMAQY